MDKKIIERAVEAAAKAMWVHAEKGPDPVWTAAAWDDMGGSEPTDERAEWELLARVGVTAALNKVVGQLATERDYYRGLLDAHGKCICDTNPATTDGPQEFCPWHGRRYTEILEWGQEQAERAARVEALLDEWTSQVGTGSHVADVMGRQTITVDFAVAELRKAIRGESE